MADDAISALFDEAQVPSLKTIICELCGVSVAKRKPSGPQKYCDGCRDARKAETKRAASRKYSYTHNGTVPSGTGSVCEWCSVQFESRKGGNKFCCDVCQEESWLARRWRKRIEDAVRVVGQIVLCECCFETYEFDEHSNNNRCQACEVASSEITLRELWNLYQYRRTAGGIAERKRKYFRHYKDRKRVDDPRYVLDERMSDAIRSSLKRGKQGESWKSMVDYTVDQLKEHLERQFLPRMSWDNMGKWHIDHIVPKVSFEYEDQNSPDFKACWSLTNLRPLWALDNISKGGRRIFLI